MRSINTYWLDWSELASQWLLLRFLSVRASAVTIQRRWRATLSGRRAREHVLTVQVGLSRPTARLQRAASGDGRDKTVLPHQGVISDTSPSSVETCHKVLLVSIFVYIFTCNYKRSSNPTSKWLSELVIYLDKVIIGVAFCLIKITHFKNIL